MGKDPESPVKKRNSFFRRSSIRSNARNSKIKLQSGMNENGENFNDFDTIKSSKIHSSNGSSGERNSFNRPPNIDVDFNKEDMISELSSPRKRGTESRFSKGNEINLSDLQDGNFSSSNRDINIKKQNSNGGRLSMRLKNSSRAKNEKKSRFKDM